MWRNRILGCVAVVVLGTGSGALAEEDGLMFGLTGDFFSKYVWRGQNVTDDWVFQPGASIGYKGFTASIWANLDLTGELVDRWEFSEVDYALDYSGAIPGQEWLGYSLGVIHYRFPNTGWDPTTEIYGGLSLDVPLSPALVIYYDVDQVEGAYVELSVGHTVDKFIQWREDRYCDIEVGASLGYGTGRYNEGYFDVDGSGFNDLTLSAGLPICLGRWTITPIIAYSTLIDSDIRRATEKSDNFWGGISIAVEF